MQVPHIKIFCIFWRDSIFLREERWNSRAVAQSGSFLGELPFCFKKRDRWQEMCAMRAAGGEVGNGFEDHAVGEAGSGDLHEGGAFVGGVVGVDEEAHFDNDIAVVVKSVSPAFCRILDSFLSWLEFCFDDLGDFGLAPAGEDSFRTWFGVIRNAEWGMRRDRCGGPSSHFATPAWCTDYYRGGAQSKS